MTSEQTSYRQILKTTSLFGGVQVFQILIQIIKSKAIAVLLGTTGMGIAGLLITTTGFLAAITSFGLGTSGIKSIAEADGTGDEIRIARTVNVLKKSVWITGLLGMVMTIVLAPWLSQLTFGNKDYTFAFVWLSITFIFDQLSTGQLVILQGLRKYRYLANANLTGALFGLLISLPLYYKWGIDGIVPAIIVTSLVNLFRSWYFSKKVKIKKVHVENDLAFAEAKLLFKLGFVISLSGIVGIASSYLIRIYISNYGGLEQVGLYSAGYTLLNTYVGLVFAAMGKDYFPRLAANVNDNIYTQKAVNEQAEISFLLLAPILVVFLILCPLIIKILYTGDFIAIDKMLYWSSLGMLFRAASWSLSFIFVAKGNAKIFFINETMASAYILLLNIAGYFIWGLEGIGVAFLIGYIIYLLHMTILSIKLYKIKIHSNAIRLFVFLILFIGIAFGISYYLTDFIRYASGIPIILGCLTYSYINLDKRMNLSDYLRNFRKRKNNS